MFSLDCPLIPPRALDCPLALPLRVPLPDPVDPAAEPPADPPEALPDPVADPLPDPVAEPLLSWLDPEEDAPLPFDAPPEEPLEPPVCDHTRLPLSAIVPLKTIPDKINNFRCIRSSPFRDCGVASVRVCATDMPRVQK
jgi:hypothetical protein